MMEKWQSVYADQLGLVDSGLTTSMWQAPALSGAHLSFRPLTLHGTSVQCKIPSSLRGGETSRHRYLNPITITARPFSLFADDG
jgi:hypothetical protein